MLNFAIVVDKPIRHSPLVVDKAHQWGCLIYAYKFFDLIQIYFTPF